PRPDPLWFVDGVRRVEVRVVARRADRLAHGVLGAYAVGAVRVDGATARLLPPTLGRLAVLGSGERLVDPIAVHPAAVYLPDSVADDGPDAPADRIQHRMRAAEAVLAEALAESDSGLVVTDGPLQTRDQGRAVGLVKRIVRLYLPPELLPVLGALPVGGRTPLFALAGAWARFAWYLRLVDRRPGDADLTGLVRLEVGDGVGLDAAVARADATAGWLPAFAGRRGLDPRAPQNLLPIGALEAALRHALGPVDLVSRRVASLLHAQEVADGR
ncbi:MAG: hypothetical protein ABMA64_26095, partial [Myxococcota bacterium]